MNLEICSSKIDVNILYRIAHGALLKKAIVPHSFDPTKVFDRVVDVFTYKIDGDDANILSSLK